MDRPNSNNRNNDTMSVKLEDLHHYGVKGMHWGVKKDRSSAPASSDYKKIQGYKKRIKRGGIETLSTQEFKELVAHMNLEQQYSKMIHENGNTFAKGHSTVKEILKVGKTLNDVHTFINSPVGKKMRKGFKQAQGS